MFFAWAVILTLLCDVHGYSQTIIDIHNQYRREEGASNMNKLVWNDTIAKTVESWVGRCVFKHEGNAFGQNLAASTGTNELVNIQTAIKDWFGEKDKFKMGQSCSVTGSCHYTQVVWANSKQVGCAAKQCASFDADGDIWSDTWFFGCYYYPPGNVFGELPYKIGSACTECALKQVCDEKLCADP